MQSRIVPLDSPSNRMSRKLICDVTVDMMSELNTKTRVNKVRYRKRKVNNLVRPAAMATAADT
jgi:hypothetical protein